MKVSEDTLQASGEIIEKMKKIQLSLIDLAEVSDAYPEDEDVKRQLLALQREGIRLGKLYRWLVQG